MKSHNKCMILYGMLLCNKYGYKLKWMERHINCKWQKPKNVMRKEGKISLYVSFEEAKH